MNHHGDTSVNMNSTPESQQPPRALLIESVFPKKSKEDA